MKTIRFVRTLRNKGQKFGYAIDKAGKIWGGFSTDWDDARVHQRGQLGPVGLCFCCGGRVFSGWTSYSEKTGLVRDIHASCAVTEKGKVFVVDINDKDFNRLAKKFIRLSGFICPDVS